MRISVITNRLWREFLRIRCVCAGQYRQQQQRHCLNYKMFQGVFLILRALSVRTLRYYANQEKQNFVRRHSSEDAAQIY